MIVTMKDIAKAVGVSQPTVSAVLRDKEYCYVSQKKKDLIKKTAKEMGYVPNQSALNLKGMPSKTIGIIGSLFGVPIHMQFTNHLTRMIWESGYHVMLGDSKGGIKRERDIINDFMARGVDAFVITGAEYKRENVYKNLKHIFLNPGSKNADAQVDIEEGECQAVKHLTEKHGHEKIMFFCSKIKSNATKLDGYKKALKENNIEISEDLIIEAEQEKNTAEKLINYFEKGKFTAISATSDELALKLISFFAKNNIKTPEDIAIIGFDDLPFCKNINPTLSSVRQPMEQHAKNTLKLLMELLDGKEKSDLNKAIAKTRLICRESCGCKIKQEFNDDYFNLRIQR